MIKELCTVINKDFNLSIDIIKGLNELLESPEFYNIVCDKKHGNEFSSDVKDLAGCTNNIVN